MQKTLAAATLAAVLGMGGAAYAADVYAGGGGLKDAPVVLSDWSGVYFGIGVGGGATVEDLKGEISKHGKTEATGELKGFGGEGPLGTVEVGYDRQYGRFVGGIFFDYDFTDIQSSASYSTKYQSGSVTLKYNDSWTVGGRVGYLIADNVLAYGLAGYTQANFSVPAGLLNPTRDGYTVGGGLETRLAGNWFLKVEYRYTDLSEKTLFNGLLDYCHSAKLTDQTDIQSGRLVLSYKADIFGRSYEPLK
jgi:outer membrane immunogenic protein